MPIASEPRRCASSRAWVTADCVGRLKRLSTRRKLDDDGTAGAGRYGRPVETAAVIFDLGGVLAEFVGIESMRRLSGARDDEDVWRRWLTCRWVRSFEQGTCSAEDFATGVVGDWDLPVTPEAFLHEFGGWAVGPLEGAEELVAEVRLKVPVGCLSNTNAVHWERGRSWPLLAGFDHLFLSFRMGLVKPDPEIFELVCRTLGVGPERVVFLDDNTLNVEAAEGVGLRAARVRGVAEARRALVETGVLEEDRRQPA